MNTANPDRPLVKHPPQRLLGLAAIALAIAFNIPYAILASIYQYPDILRRPPGLALDLFAAGGDRLILTWYGFALAALAFMPLAVSLALQPRYTALAPALTIGAALAGSLSGMAQAIGLLRWVFVIPGLAAHYTDPAATDAVRLSAEIGFALLNAYGGVAIGEHLGQLLLVGFVLSLARLQWLDGARLTALAGYLTAAALGFGTGEGLALALGGSGDLFSLGTITGFLGLTVWLILTGVNAMRHR
jgi:hypothetical protein